MNNSVNVLLFVESRYKVNRKRIKTTIKNKLQEQGINDTPVEISVAIVGDRKMKILNKQYRGLDKTTNVLSFPLTEGEPVVSATETLKLGDIVISYPQVVRESARDDMLIDDKVDDLILHSLEHLLGIHHE